MTTFHSFNPDLLHQSCVVTKFNYANEPEYSITEFIERVEPECLYFASGNFQDMKEIELGDAKVDFSTDKLKIKVGGWGEIEECMICEKEYLGGVIVDPQGSDDPMGWGDEVCNDCLKKYLVEIK